MAFVNQNYCNLKESYLFSQIAHKVAEFTAAHPEKKIIKMGIGDVTLPLAPAVIEAMQKAVAEMGVKETFRGYGPEQGYDFLHEAIAGYYAGFGVSVASDEIFVSDGAKSDCGNFVSDGAKSDCGNMTDIFSNDNVILIPDPVYPVYLDTNVMCGRKIIYMQGKPENDFLPMPDDSVKADIIYLCSPNNPTGAVYTKEQLEKWVAYALKNDAVILYDAAYDTNPLSATLKFRAAFLLLKALKNVQLNCALFPKLQALPAPAAVIPLCRMIWYAKPKTAGKCH